MEIIVFPTSLLFEYVLLLIYNLLKKSVCRVYLRVLGLRRLEAIACYSFARDNGLETGFKVRTLFECDDLRVQSKDKERG